MKIRSQVGMVLNLDKCIGCHTCSVTCKNVWTSREGVEYAWFNNVETKPGIGYPIIGKTKKNGKEAGSAPLRVNWFHVWGTKLAFYQKSSLTQMYLLWMIIMSRLIMTTAI
ncbi:Respiratory nitrate reductase 2 beta chain [Providencia rettgeri]|nr:Respiratory nitrate reductase 2 beta chain [Providencia rettgeri]